MVVLALLIKASLIANTISKHIWTTSFWTVILYYIVTVWSGHFTMIYETFFLTNTIIYHGHRTSLRTIFTIIIIIIASRYVASTFAYFVSKLIFLATRCTLFSCCTVETIEETICYLARRVANSVIEPTMWASFCAEFFIWIFLVLLG